MTLQGKRKAKLEILKFLFGQYKWFSHLKCPCKLLIDNDTVKSNTFVIKHVPPWVHTQRQGWVCYCQNKTQISSESVRMKEVNESKGSFPSFSDLNAFAFKNTASIMKQLKNYGRISQEQLQFIFKPKTLLITNIPCTRLS